MGSLGPSFKGRHQSAVFSYRLAATVLAALFMVIPAIWTFNRGEVVDDNKIPVLATSKAISLTDGEIDGVTYYHCLGNGGAEDSSSVPLILLHGSKFTKEDWKSAGIMQDLCRRQGTNKWSVFAMDLATTADFKDLRDLIDSMEVKSLLTKPVSLLTPSASGKTIISWTQSLTAKQTLPVYFQKWIPVATNSVMNAPTDHIQMLKAIPILAIYGDQDVGGKQSSERLQSTADAKVVELHGRHPCYLDSPTEFVDEVIKFLEA